MPHNFLDCISFDFKTFLGYGLEAVLNSPFLSMTVNCKRIFQQISYVIQKSIFFDENIFRNFSIF